jgi:hypothetical protein
MGFSRARTGKDGKPRYTAYYLDIRGKERSAGTYGSEKKADRAWQKAEAEVAAGKVGDPRRGRQTRRRSGPRCVTAPAAVRTCAPCAAGTGRAPRSSVPGIG